MNRRGLLERLVRGAVHNVSFADMRNLVEAYGFRLVRRSSSHHIYGHGDIEELVNLQDVKGEAKPYQIRQFLRLVEKYNLHLKEES